MEGAGYPALLDLVFGIFSEGYRTLLGQRPELPETKMAAKRLLEAPGKSAPRATQERFGLLYVVASGCIWLHVVACGCKWW